MDAKKNLQLKVIDSLDQLVDWYVNLGLERAVATDLVTECVDAWLALADKQAELRMHLGATAALLPEDVLKAPWCDIRGCASDIDSSDCRPDVIPDVIWVARRWLAYTRGKRWLTACEAGASNCL